MLSPKSADDYVRVWLFVTCVFLVLACTIGRTLAHTPTASMAASEMIGENTPMPASVEVELDIFSGMPNPKWVLTNEEADSFVRQVAALRRISPKKLSGNLGYRGFIVHVTQGADKQLIYIQNGTGHISEGEKKIFVYDKGRKLERWLLNTGKPHLKSDVFGIVEREFR